MCVCFIYIKLTRFIFLFFTLSFEFLHGLWLFVKFLITLWSAFFIVRHDLRGAVQPTVTNTISQCSQTSFHIVKMVIELTTCVSWTWDSFLFSCSSSCFFFFSSFSFFFAVFSFFLISNLSKKYIVSTNQADLTLVFHISRGFLSTYRRFSTSLFSIRLNSSCSRSFSVICSSRALSSASPIRSSS